MFLSRQAISAEADFDLRQPPTSGGVARRKPRFVN
jgi:hypothetical protein